MSRPRVRRRTISTPGKRKAGRWTLSKQNELLALYRVITVAARARDLEKACTRIASSISTFSDFEMVAIERFVSGPDVMEFIGIHGTGSVIKSGMRVPAAETLSGVAVRTGKPVVESEALERKEYTYPRLRRLRVRTFVSVPLKVKGCVFGALTVASREKRAVTNSFVRFLSTLAEEVAWLIDSKLSEEKYRQFFHGALDSVLVMNPRSLVILDANRQASRMTGYKRQELIGRPVFDLHPPDEVQRQREAYELLRKHGEIKNLRTVNFVHKRGKIVPAEIDARTVTIGGQEIVVSVVRDITEQKKSEVKLAASEELLRIIVEGTQDMFFYVHDTRGIFTYVSPSVKRITGHGVREWMDHYTKYITANPINAQVMTYTEKTLKEGTVSPTYPCEINHADGHPILLEINERPIFRDGRVIGIQGVARDITEKKILENAIIESRDYLNRILEQTPLAVEVFDAEGNTVDLNEAMMRLIGVESKDDVIGKFNARTSAFVQSSDLKYFVEAAFAGETVDIPPFTVDPKVVDPKLHLKGNEATIHARLFPVFDRSSRLVNVVAMVEDVSDRRRLEEQLFQSQKMESIGLLAGGIAHDFNNILGGILGYSSYLKTKVSKDDAIFSHLDTIERSALRAAELTSKLLAFARGGKYDVRALNINEVVGETMRLLRGSMDTSIVFEEQLHEGLPAIEADAGQMQQVIMNLCVNARDAMPGGGKLTLTTDLVAQPDRFLRSQHEIRKGRYVRLRVADTGTGMEKSVMARIFEPFFTTKEKGKGTGLGLATVYGIVRNHGGYIDVQSEVGLGTTFAVYLPAVEKRAVTIEQSGVWVRGGSETILVVDDEDMIRSLVRDILQSKGYTVLEAHDGPQALELYRNHGNTIDLVILDMAMPMMSGSELFARLKMQNEHVKTILSTGYSEDERARELMSLGVKAFVQKPYRVTELAAAVRKVLDGTPADQ